MLGQHMLIIDLCLRPCIAHTMRQSIARSTASSKACCRKLRKDWVHHHSHAWRSERRLTPRLRTGGSGAPAGSGASSSGSKDWVRRLLDLMRMKASFAVGRASGRRSRQSCGPVKLIIDVLSGDSLKPSEREIAPRLSMEQHPREDLECRAQTVELTGNISNHPGQG